MSKEANLTEADVSDDLTTMEQYSFLTLCMFLLLVGLFITAKMRSRGILSVPESAVLLLLGALTQLILNAVAQGNPIAQAVEAMTGFNEKLFFFVLLPPIIFEAGYTVPRQHFFGNFGIVCALAFLGTFITMLVTGAICWAWANSAGSNMYPMNLVDSMIFGSIVSATDPVAVLVAFSQLGIDTTIFVAVFGEAVLNDAVAIVLYNTLLPFRSSVSDTAYLDAFAQFLLIFFCSTALGCVLGALASLLFKYAHMPDSAVKIEMAMMLAIPYFTYFLAQALGLSGIVAIMFCGICISRYGHHSFSPQCAEFVHSAYGALAQAFESFVFLYLGLAFGNFDDDNTQDLAFAGASVLAVIVARVVHVLVSVLLCNLFRSQARSINVRGTLMLSIVGLRGPTAFALASSAATKLGRAGQVMRTSTIVVIVVTTLSVGTLTPWLIRRLRLSEEGSGSSGGWCGKTTLARLRGNSKLPDQSEGSAEKAEVVRPNILYAFEEKYILPWLSKDLKLGNKSEVECEHLASTLDDEDDDLHLKMEGLRRGQSFSSFSAPASPKALTGAEDLLTCTYANGPRAPPSFDI